MTRMVNMGFSADFGAVYSYNDKWEFSTSIIDLGVINWNKDVTSYVSSGKTFEFNGIDVLDYIDDNNLDTDSLIQEIKDSISDVFEFEEVYDDYNTALTPKWYIGAKYKYTDNHWFYATGNLQFFKNGIRPAISLGYEFRLEDKLSLTANYSIMSGSFANIGIGVQVRGGPFQFYIMSDNVLASLDILNYQTIHYRFGINFLFGEVEDYRTTRSYLP